jgi:tRNA 2-thiouridine synthesizing protein A
MDHLIDSMGDICPIPIIKAERKLKEINTDERIILETDHSCSSSSVVNHFKTKYGYPTEIIKVSDGVWQIIILKTD